MSKNLFGFAQTMYTHPTSRSEALAAALAVRMYLEPAPMPKGLLTSAMGGWKPPEIHTSDRLKSLAGKLMHHVDPEVRDLAALALREIERYEDGK